MCFSFYYLCVLSLVNLNLDHPQSNWNNWNQISRHNNLFIATQCLHSQEWSQVCNTTMLKMLAFSSSVSSFRHQWSKTIAYQSVLFIAPSPWQHWLTGQNQFCRSCRFRQNGSEFYLKYIFPANYDQLLNSKHRVDGCLSLSTVYYHQFQFSVNFSKKLNLPN